MSEYKPSTIVVKLAEKLHANPIAEHIYPDGRIVIVFEDGRKLSFDRDDITRTLTEPASENPELPDEEAVFSENSRLSLESHRKRKR